MRSLGAALSLGFLVVALGACGEEVAAADAGAGGGSFAIDSGPRPHFRDAGCGGGGTSGSSGSGTSGTSGEGCGITDTPDASPPDASPPCDYHTFVYAGSATTVWVTGTFTSWAETPADGAWVLLPDGGGGAFRRAGQIGSGRQLYKLVIDGTTWIADPANASSEPDGLGGLNSVVETCGGPD